MQDKKLIALIILGIAAVFSLVYGIVTPSKIRREAFLEPSGIKKEVEASLEIKTMPAARRSQKSRFSAWGKDPFSPSSALSSQTTVSEMALTGILWDDVAPLAMINDNTVGVMDKVGGYTVLDIQKDRVILNDGAENHELRLLE